MGVLLFPLRSGEHEISLISWFRGFSQVLMELVSGQAQLPSFFDVNGFCTIPEHQIGMSGVSSAFTWTPVPLVQWGTRESIDFVVSWIQPVADGTVSGQALLP